MSHEYDIVRYLTSEPLPAADQLRILKEFAYGSGWRPSDRLEIPELGSFANAHLLVEHGLENSAVITFLRYPTRYIDLDHATKNHLMTVSYNNLVDWHIQIQFDQILYVFNRTKPARVVETLPISEDKADNLRSEVFEQVVGKRPSPNLLALDEALIETVSYWKRKLSAELASPVSNEAFSALFNAIIFFRAVEDHARRFAPQHSNGYPRVLLKAVDDAATKTSRVSLAQLIPQSVRNLIHSGIPDQLLDKKQLRVFDNLDAFTVRALVSDFYENRHTPYPYDFLLMSKHALSRIYEHYVSILRLEDSPQLDLLPRLPEEQRDKAYGNVYTPQFIARFFARYLREQMPPVTFKRMRTADPGCGSGIFLRTLLELQCDPAQDGIRTDVIQESFQKVLGLDVDPNASQATRLSLSLLHLVLTDHLPPSLQVVTADSIEYFKKHPELRQSFDAVLVNPPFVSRATQNETLWSHLSEFMQEYAVGRTDMYLAFLRIGLEMLKPGGYGLYVLPHSFLLGKSASKMRKVIYETSWIRCLADLSAIRVFPNSDIYVVLLIFQKKEAEQKPPLATIVKCQDLVGQALQDTVENRRVATNFYSIYDVDQETFSQNEWILLPPTELEVKRKLDVLPTLDQFLYVREGLISGADDIFIVQRSNVPKDEQKIFVPFLHDREMQTYTVPDRPSRYVFYPYIGDRKITEEEVKTDYPKTWKYLSAHKEDLENRLPVKKKQLTWWEPTRPRHPNRLLRPKIVSPHLVLVPRFSIDLKGKYAISRAPLLYPKGDGAENDLLRFFVAVLNSTACYWYISTHSHTYQRGYVMLEPKTLRRTPVPDPSKVSSKTMRRLIQLVNKRLDTSGTSATEIEKEIDELICDLYGLSHQERRVLGLEV